MILNEGLDLLQFATTVGIKSIDNQLWILLCGHFDSTSTVVSGTGKVLATTDKQKPIITLMLSKVRYTTTFASMTTALSVLVVSGRYS